VLSKRLNSADPLWQEIAGHQFTSSADQILGLLDVPGLPGSDGSLVISDDRPIVEYPEMLKQRLRVAELPFELPKPDSSHSHRDQNH
jgi:hypothetical protein